LHRGQELLVLRTTRVRDDQGHVGREIGRELAKLGGHGRVGLLRRSDDDDGVTAEQGRGREHGKLPGGQVTGLDVVDVRALRLTGRRAGSLAAQGRSDRALDEQFFLADDEGQGCLARLSSRSRARCCYCHIRSL